MVKHIVMWKLKDYAEQASKSENAQKLKVRLERLKAVIPEIQSIEVGINLDTSEAAYDIVLYSEFKSKEDLRAYQAHPEHQKLISEFLEHVRIDKKVVDYEIKETS